MADAMAILDELDAQDALRETKATKAPKQDAALAQEPAAPPRVTSVPPKDKKALQAKIDAGMIPQKTNLERAWEALKESNTAAGQQLLDRSLMGIPGRVARAAGVYGEPVQQIPYAGTVRRGEDYLPNEGELTGLPAAAVDMATVGGAFGKAGQTLAQAPAQIARKLGASEAATAVRPGLQAGASAAGAGAVYGGSDAALRGGDLTDVGAGALEGAAGNVVLGQLPAVAGRIEDAARSAIVKQAVRPLVGIGQGQKADKALKGLGKGDTEMGRAELERVVSDEGLAPIINRSPIKAAPALEAKLEEVWAKELGPIRSIALNAEPEAKIPVKRIQERLESLIGNTQRGTDAHDDVIKALDLLKTRAGTIGNKSQFPVENLLKNAQEFEHDGFGGTVAKFADGKMARAIGKELRTLADERISQIYVKNPKLVRQALGKPEPEDVPRILPTGEINPDYQPKGPFGIRKPKDAAWFDENARDDVLNLEALGDKYMAARGRYANLKKVQPLVEQLAMRRAQERPGLINTMVTGGQHIIGGTIGAGVGGVPGMIAGLTVPTLVRGGVPLAIRGAGAAASPFAGPAVEPRLSGAAAGRQSLPQVEDWGARVLGSEDRRSE